MTFYEIEKVRQNLSGDSTNVDNDDIIHSKGTEADNWLVRTLTALYEESGRLKTLPIFDITAGTINGSAASQDIKDLSTNRTTYLCLIVRREFESLKEYKEHITQQLEGIKQGLQTAEDVHASMAII